MSDKIVDSEKKIPSPSPSSARVEKSNSSSSRRSGSTLPWEFETCLTSETLSPDARVRPSSWDDSEDDSFLEPMKASEPSRLYSSEDKKYRGSIVAEINELKKQFFESLQKIQDEGDNQGLQNLRDKLEMISDSDRRHSPARVRRRSKSSGSSSPILETKSQNSPEKLSESDGVFDEISSKILEFDQKFYLNNFFTELRSKRISLIDSPSVTDKIELNELVHCDNDTTHVFNELNNASTTDDGLFSNTSRKLSQILEVEESKKELRKSSEESIGITKLFSISSRKPDENDFSPLQTARSKISEKMSAKSDESKKSKKNKYKSLSSEYNGNFLISKKPCPGSLSDRSHKILGRKIDEDYITLSAKSGKTQLVLPNKKPLQFVCLTSPLAGKNHYSQKKKLEKKEIEKKKNSPKCLKIDLMKNMESENSSPRKSTARSEHTSRSKSGRSRNSSNPESPKFLISLGKDSARSLKVEDVSTPNSPKEDTDNKTLTEPNLASLEDCSSLGNSKSTDRSENSFEPKTERNLQIQLDNLSLQSVKSTTSSPKNQDVTTNQASYNSTQRSKSKHNSQRKDSPNNHIVFTCEKEDNFNLMESDRSYVKPHNSYRSEFSTKSTDMKSPINSKPLSEKSTNSQNSKSSRSSKSVKEITSTIEEDHIIDYSANQSTPKSNKTPEPCFPLNILEKSEFQTESHRSMDEVKNTSDRSGTNAVRQNSRRSERSSSSKSRNTGSRKSTPRSLKITARTNSSSSSRSKDSLEIRDDNAESLERFNWKELEKNCDTLSNISIKTSSSKKSNWREMEIPSQQYLHASEIPDLDHDDSSTSRAATPTAKDSPKEKSSRSKKSSGKSKGSEAAEPLKNSPSTKSRSNWISEEHDFTNFPSNEEINAEKTNEKASNINFLFVESEDAQETQITARSRSEIESDRFSDKRLSVINEVSFEDLQTSNISTENEEKSARDQSRPPSKKSSKRSSIKSAKPTPRDNSEALEKSPKLDEIPTHESSDLDGKKWNDLIETFDEDPFILGNPFPGFPYKKENLWNSPKSPKSEKNLFIDNEYDEITKDSSMFLTKLENSYESPKKRLSIEKAMEEKEDDLNNVNLVYHTALLEKIVQEKDVRAVQNSSNLYFFNVENQESFGIGEFGDVTCWNAGKSDTIDSEKPKDHGDGIHLQNTPEVLALPEKRDKEIKRLLWTELKEDFRDSSSLSNKQFWNIQSNTDIENFVPVNVRTSKSDNFIEQKKTETNKSHTSAAFEFEDFSIKEITKEEFDIESFRKENSNQPPNSRREQFSSLESLQFDKEVEENPEFECEITPRLSRSLSNLEPQIQCDRLKSRNSSETYFSSKTHLFEKSTNNTDRDQESTNLNIFLACNDKNEKTEVKSNNWLNIKNPEKSLKKEKKSKKKRKGVAASKEQLNEYLSSRKSRSSVPHLKLRNSNCFQNFYKRFISVFCLTSQSSAATSK